MVAGFGLERYIATRLQAEAVEPFDDVLELPVLPEEPDAEADEGRRNGEREEPAEAAGIFPAVCVIALERFHRLVRQLRGARADELAFATVRAVFYIVGNACSTLAPHRSRSFAVSFYAYHRRRVYACQGVEWDSTSPQRKRGRVKMV